MKILYKYIIYLIVFIPSKHSLSISQVYPTSKPSNGYDNVVASTERMKCIMCMHKEANTLAHKQTHTHTSKESVCNSHIMFCATPPGGQAIKWACFVPICRRP